MGNSKILTADELRRFLESSAGMEFSGAGRAGVYEWIEQTLRRYNYSQQGKEVKGLLRGFLIKTTGLSVAQLTRLVRRFVETGQVAQKFYRRRRFPRLYTKQDIELLATVDEAHGRLSGPATQRILKREHDRYGRLCFKRLAGISVSHLYNLRRTKTYQTRSRVMGKTNPVKAIHIGQRRPPEPDGCAGYIRIDTVHQPERDGVKSVYHINAVDQVTQWEVVGCVARISERHLIPVIQCILEQFPFRVRGFHSDNGSEFVNQTVAGLLEKLHVEFTRSRPRRTNDNALAESKNGSVVRKNVGYQWLPPSHASEIHDFYKAWFNPYLNFHRPCGFATVTTDAKGKQKKVYDVYLTPLEKLQSLPRQKRSLKKGLTMPMLEKIAMAASDTEFATTMQRAKRALFQLCDRQGAGRPKRVELLLGSLSGSTES